MRQHITSEHLNKLSDKGKEKLREWWKPQQSDLMVSVNENDLFTRERTAVSLHPNPNPTNEEKKEWLPLLSIGQCLEYILDHELFWDGETPRVSLDSTLPGCLDSLWKIVKKDLEK